ncbi:MAG: leucine-rich repeat protein [Christensenellales bacterium]
MKKRLVVIITLVLLMIMCMTSAVSCVFEEHGHQYVLQYDDTHHWYECKIADCPDKIRDKNPHNNDGVDGACSICGYKPQSEHQHVWEIDWSYNETYHWHKCVSLDCSEKDSYATHTYNNGVCICGYREPDEGGADNFENIFVDAEGDLHWNKIKGASRYELEILFAGEEYRHTFSIDKSKLSVALNTIRAEGFPIGKSSIKLIAYEIAEVRIDDETVTQEVPMTNVQDTFLIIKNNGKYSLTRLKYQDDFIKLDGFYSEKVTNNKGKEYYLYELPLTNNEATRFDIFSCVKALNGGRVELYKSKDGRDNEDSSDKYSQYDWFMVDHGEKMAYARVRNGNSMQDYDLCIYGLYAMTVKRYNSTITEKEGLRETVNNQIGEDIILTERDILGADKLFESVENGKLGRDRHYNIYENKDLIVEALGYGENELAIYFYDENMIRSDCLEYVEMKKAFYLIEYDDYWDIRCENGVKGMVRLPNSICGKKVASADFSYSKISTLIVEEGVETLNTKFLNCSNLTNIFLPSTITSMKKQSFVGTNSNIVVCCAFSSSYAKNNFDLTWNYYSAYAEAKTEYNVAIPENVLTIDAGMMLSKSDKDDELVITYTLTDFSGEIPDTLSVADKTYKITQIIALGNCESVHIGNNINYIEDGSLRNVKSISIDKGNGFFVIENDILYSKDFSSLISICNKAVQELTIDSRVANIPFGCLAGLTSLHTLTIPFVGASLEGNEDSYIGYIFGAESYEDNSTVIPSSLTNIIVTGGDKICDYAFYDCKNIKEIIIPQEVTSIGAFAFRGCSVLENIEIPACVTLIGENAFENCSKLVGLYINDLAAWCEIDFINEKSNALYNPNCKLYVNDVLLTNLVVDENASKVNKYAFYNCSSLTSINISDSVTSIGISAFRGCSNLVEMTIPFVGATKDGSSTTHFGYIFGASSYSNNSSYVPSKLKCVTITGGTSIGAYAFYGCSGLTNIILANSVTRIGNRAFYDCNSLTSISIPDSIESMGEYAFYRCYSLTSIDIPNSLTYIGNSVFQACSGLKDITIPNGVTSISNSAFSGCSSLTSINIPDNVTSIGNYAFSGCSSLTSINIPDNVTSIGNYAFCDCSSFTSINIPDSVTSIGNSAFSGCSSLESMSVPFVGATKNGNSNTHFSYIFGANSYSDTLTNMPESLISVTVTGGMSIGKYAFYMCENLTRITIPNSVTSIGNYAFGACYGITNIVLPNSVTSIGNNAFYDCSSLISISIPNGVESIGEYTFGRCSNLTSITIPNSVTSIVDCAFYKCSSLTSINIPDSVTSIGGSAFYGCSSLTSVTIPANVILIGAYAFNDCSNLTRITIPENVTSIKQGAFKNCSSLANITFQGTKEQWNTISKESYWNDNTGQYTIYCTDGNISK